MGMEVLCLGAPDYLNNSGSKSVALETSIKLPIFVYSGYPEAQEFLFGIA
jgi:hypothetical protein